MEVYVYVYVAQLIYFLVVSRSDGHCVCSIGSTLYLCLGEVGVLNTYFVNDFLKERTYLYLYLPVILRSKPTPNMMRRLENY